MNRRLETNSEQASTIRASRQPHVPRLSRVSRPQIIPLGSDSPNEGTLADQIEQFGHALTAVELAELLSVSRITVFKLAKVGRIPCFRIGTCVRFDPRAVANWLRSR